MRAAKGIPVRLTLCLMEGRTATAELLAEPRLSSNCSLLLTGHKECGYFEKQNGQSQLLPCHRDGQNYPSILRCNSVIEGTRSLLSFATPALPWAFSVPGGGHGAQCQDQPGEPALPLEPDHRHTGKHWLLLCGRWDEDPESQGWRLHAGKVAIPLSFYRFQTQRESRKMATRGLGVSHLPCPHLPPTSYPNVAPSCL